MLKCFVAKNFRGTRSSVEMLKGYMLICQNAERVHVQRKVGNPCSRLCSNVVVKTIYEGPKKDSDAARVIHW